MGTPHCGSDIAAWAVAGTNMLKLFKRCNSGIVKVLQSKSLVLQRTQEEFFKWLERRRDPRLVNRPVSIANIIEELPVKLVGKVCSCLVNTIQ
jgi:hypothetical protein